MNRLFSEQLPSALNNQLASVYVLTGQDPLLLDESQQSIVQAARRQGFDEKNEVQIEVSTDWQALFESCQSMGLFFDKQIFILNLPENLTALLQKNLLAFIELLHEDILPIFILPKLAKATEKHEWFVRLTQYGNQAVMVNCQTPTLAQFPRWVANRAKHQGMQLEQDAVQLLCYSYENNLLALKQALDLLALLYPNQKITFALAKSVVEQSSVFTPFQWVDALLEGKEARAQRILKGLQAEDVQPVILLRTLQRELITLLELSKPPVRLDSIDQTLPTTQLREQFDRLKVWQNRRPFFTQAFQRLTYRKLYLLIQQLADLERTAKQDFSADIWDGLADISLQFSLSD